MAEEGGVWQDKAMPNSQHVECPACGAKPGEPCKTMTGKTMPESHSKRKIAALAARYSREKRNSAPGRSYAIPNPQRCGGHRPKLAYGDFFGITFRVISKAASAYCGARQSFATISAHTKSLPNLPPARPESTANSKCGGGKTKSQVVCGMH